METFYTRAGLAQHFHITRMTLYRWLKLVPLPGVNPSSRYIHVTEKVVKEWREKIIDIQWKRMIG